MARGHSPGPAERVLRSLVPQVVHDVRRALRMTQAELGRRSGMSQSRISRLEAGAIGAVSVEEVGRMFDSLGVQMDLAVRRPNVIARPFQQDAAHARTVGYIAGRLARDGWLVRTEQAIADGPSRGWIDVLAFRPDARALFIAEIKAGITDMGAAQRQLNWYARAGIDVGRAGGWSVEVVASALLILATTENEALIAANRGLVVHAFPGRALDLDEWIAKPTSRLSGQSIALVDPRSRRRHWLVPLRLDGRRTALRYATYADFIRRPASGQAR